ncbi:MAG: DUF2924 domain-containing protein [Dehalococcoidia bacterium]|nr:DUF2924 domain-containing protein [Dehalococcoidia bacterium]
MAIEDRDLPVGTRLVANYKKARYVCSIEADEGGKLAFVLEDGKRYKSPSSAASAVMGGSAANGWKFWSLEGDAPAQVSKPAKTKKSKAFKLFRNLPPNGLEEGQRRIWCQACQKSFITTEAEPEACPEGHRADDPELTSSVGTPAPEQE